VCGTDQSAPTEALGSFLRAVQDQDAQRAEALLVPGFRVDQAAFAALAEAVTGQDVDALKMVDDQMGEGHSIVVMNGEGGLLGRFEVVEWTGQCSFISWGVPPQDGDSSNGGSPGAT
jgi:hypothetical protein